MKKIYIILFLPIILLIFLLFYHQIKDILFYKLLKNKVAFIIRDYGTRDFEKLILSKLEKSQSALNLIFSFIITKTYEEQENKAKEAINNGNKIIVFFNGTVASKFIEKLANNYKKVYFILVDTELKIYPKNVCSLTYNYRDLGFVAGNICNLFTKSGNIGFIGGMKIKSISKIEEGIKLSTEIYNLLFNKSNKFFSYYIVDYPIKTDKSPFSNPEAGSYFAKKLINENKVDFIVGGSGNSNLGIYEFSKVSKFYIINFDSIDKIKLYEDNVAFSIVRNIDVCLIALINKVIKGIAKNTNYVFGIKENSFNILSSGIFELDRDLQDKFDLLNKYYLENK
ncbi:MAG: BMP family ABC transporter substrate-binding protein [Spirochaetes bacterium]|nr:BMP family ABC transporter substrate-binding protein [Spirochaetota bacterium]